MKQKLKGVMEQSFRPEFLNRVDDIIVFRSLTKDNLKHIIDIELSKVIKRLKEKDLQLVMTDEAKEFDREGHEPRLRRPSAASGHRAAPRRPAVGRSAAAALSPARIRSR